MGCSHLFFSSTSNAYGSPEPFYTAYLSVPTKHVPLVENSDSFVVKYQFNKTRIYLIEEKHVGIIFQHLALEEILAIVEKLISAFFE